MVRLKLTVLFVLFSLIGGGAAAAPDDYQLGPDSQYHDGVPRGEVTKYTWPSKVFPGTVRDYWVYVPKQYDPSTPACVMVFQDGGGFQGANGQFRVPVVFDNLIYKKEMPVTIAIMIDPGVVPASSPNALPRYNRSYEYDAPTGQYARFLLEEILPEVGKRYNLTQDPNGRAIAGSSSGGICVFTAAWERPDQFRRVISFIGSFTNLRGGHNYPSLIRKMEPKPIRVFMQDGSNDQDIYSGSWFIGNNDVAAALKFARYDYQYVVGDGSHSGRHGGAILPDALRWLWRDYPSPIRVPESTPQPVMQVLMPGEDWQPVVGAEGTARDLAVDPAGRVVYTDERSGVVFLVGPNGQTTVIKPNTGAMRGLAFGPDGRLYGCRPGKHQIVAYDSAGKETVVTRNLAAADLVIDHTGRIYAADVRGRIWMVDSKGDKRSVNQAGRGERTLQLTPDQTLLLATQDWPDRFIDSFKIGADGSLGAAEPYFDLHIPYGATAAGASAMTVDTEGRLYVATRAGIQVCDQAGRVIGIIANPDRTPTTAVAFGGPNLDQLYAIAGGRIYRRKTRAKGVLSSQPPIKPPAPRL